MRPSSDPNLSVRGEPWLKQGGFEQDPSEALPDAAGAPDELERIRDSVIEEPALARPRPSMSAYAAWMRGKACATSRADNMAVTFMAAVVASLFAIAGAFIAGRETVFAIAYLVVFGPVTEELLKQSGMIFLIEKKPYHIFARWQLIGGAILTALLFAAIENLIYVHLYWARLEGPQKELLSAFRWQVCTAMHVLASLTASLGLVRVWRRMLAEGKPADLSAGYPWFAAAIAIHGAYNLIAVLTRSLFFF